MNQASSYSNDWLLDKLMIHDYQTYRHSTTVGVYMYRFGEWMGYDPIVCKELWNTGLYHDIGKLFVPSSILNSRSPLSAEDKLLIEQHPVKGHELILEYAEVVTPDILQGVLQHHENVDGSGYPNQLVADEIHLYAKILRIIDSYDAMAGKFMYGKRYYEAVIQKRNYQKEYTESQIIEELKKGQSVAYDHDFTEAFINFLEDSRSK